MKSYSLYILHFILPYRLFPTVSTFGIHVQVYRASAPIEMPEMADIERTFRVALLTKVNGWANYNPTSFTNGKT